MCQQLFLLEIIYSMFPSYKFYGYQTTMYRDGLNIVLCVPNNAVTLGVKNCTKSQQTLTTALSLLKLIQYI